MYLFIFLFMKGLLKTLEVSFFMRSEQQTQMIIVIITIKI